MCIRDREYTPQQVSAMILQKLKADADAYLGESVTEAVITVPAYFNEMCIRDRPNVNFCEKMSCVFQTKTAYITNDAGGFLGPSLILTLHH